MQRLATRGQWRSVAWMGWHHRYLDPAQAAAVYDRIGRWQDTQAFYERDAVAAMVAAARLQQATRVLEVGCGTGTLAAALLAEDLHPEATYRGLDVSPQMVQLTRRRVQPFGARAEVRQVDGRSAWPVPDDGVDRVLAAYLLDLLSPAMIDDFFTEAARVLSPGGLVAVTSLTPGTSGVARAVSSTWTRLWRAKPHLTGGCRPLDLGPHVPAGWTRLQDTTVTRWGICSHVLALAPSP